MLTIITVLNYAFVAAGFALSALFLFRNLYVQLQPAMAYSSTNYFTATQSSRRQMQRPLVSCWWWYWSFTQGLPSPSRSCSLPTKA